ncbi:glycosyltransferase, partial [uncultured Methylobacterium sp.]|uniref:glycosyltransferase n=1 Tax=uncultured Methylobacterium sp. TaxID=157278 RepID=UPI00258AA37C
MRIALLAHLRHPIAPPFAGGLEAYCWHLAEGLTARGHDVVLFASGDSDPRFSLDEEPAIGLEPARERRRDRV